jgi:hypothetical protein
MKQRSGRPANRERSSSLLVLGEEATERLALRLAVETAGAR